MTSQASSPAERLVARIVIARHTHPDVFDEYERELAQWRESPSFGRNGRPGVFSGQIRAFCTAGPENTVVYERNGWRETALGKRPKYSKVERWSEAEVAEGKARNDATRIAVAEHVLKLLQNASQYEVSELLLVLPSLHLDEEASALLRDHLRCRLGAMAKDHQAEKGVSTQSNGQKAIKINF